ncbi:hypothetical protein GGE09_000817 [Roseobacter sp. N2S]|nr:hypothetical protein [Roseobacter sp. N2S]
MTMQPDTVGRQSKAAQRAGKAILGLPEQFGPMRTNRMLLALLLLAFAAMPGTLGEVTRGALEDAYVGVAVFVAATLLLFYGAEKAFGFDIGTTFRNAKLAQVPLAALLGAMPGCGGAVVVVAAYSSGNVSMGAIVATLTATMGDAAFLLIAKRPEAAMILLPTSFIIGILSGYIVDLLDKRSYASETAQLEIPMIGRARKRDYVYLALILPGLFFGIAALAQVEFSGLIADFSTALALCGITVSMLVWATSPIHSMTNPDDSAVTRVTEETSFITAWVILAFLLFEYVNAFTGLDLESLFNTVGIALPLMAILVGFIPGCGPQILVTTFYINGLVPFSALIGNAIANDGDALFPAIALNPKAAFVATIYSSIPAFIVAYGFYFFAPNFL